MKKIFLALALFGLISLMTACGPRMAGHLVGAAIFGAAVASTAHVLEHHDNHYHHEYCGCPRHYHQGVYVYHYNGGWEHYDHHRGVWVVYR